MMYHLRNDIVCPKCKSNSFGIEEHIEQHPDGDRDDVYLTWWEVFCHKCDYTIYKIEK